jgi:hypothetical protein
VRLSVRERRMKCTNATKFHRKSGGAKSRDLQFYGPVLEMFFHTGQPPLKGTGFSPYKRIPVKRWL